jgi:hypothetical protein
MPFGTSDFIHLFATMKLRKTQFFKTLLSFNTCCMSKKTQPEKNVDKKKQKLGRKKRTTEREFKVMF